MQIRSSEHLLLLVDRAGVCVEMERRRRSLHLTFVLSLSAEPPVCLIGNKLHPGAKKKKGSGAPGLRYVDHLTSDIFPFNFAKNVNKKKKQGGS